MTFKLVSFLEMVEDVLKAYDLENATFAPIGNGLINRTWKVMVGSHHFVLQRINTKIFQQPHHIAFNIKLIGDHLQAHHPGYLFTRPIAALNGEEMISVDDGCYRLFLFIEGSHTIEVVNTSAQAYEAASQFGTFTQILSGLDVTALRITISQFHDLGLRYNQFLKATKEGNAGRIVASKDLIETLLEKREIVAIFNAVQSNKAFKKRVTHHDTKISNVLFDQGGKGLCVIDLDTVMPGYFISDAGDMLRTYLSPTTEEESDWQKIEIRADFYTAIAQGYVEGMKDELTTVEQNHFFYAGEAMIYMQALRFLTDHLNNDVYYGDAYEGHNLVRAKNQLTLLQRLQEKRTLLQAVS